MSLVAVTAQQVAQLFLLMAAGFACTKLGVLKPGSKQVLSRLLLFLVTPCMILDSYQMEFSREILHNLLRAFALSAGALLLGVGLTLLLTCRSKGEDMRIFRIACMFSNAGYMGFPLIRALYGDEGMLYASAFVSMFNLILWTIGYAIVSGKSDGRQIVHSILSQPALWAVFAGLAIYLLQIPLPDVVSGSISLLGDMNTPLSMLIIGMLIAAADLPALVRDRRIWAVAAMHGAVIPLMCFSAMALLRLGGSTVAEVVLLLECCPTATTTSVLAVQFGLDEDFAVGSVVLTTLLSILALPVCSLLLTALR